VFLIIHHYFSTAKSGGRVISASCWYSVGDVEGVVLGVHVAIDVSVCWLVAYVDYIVIRMSGIQLKIKSTSAGLCRQTALYLFTAS
jgi:hypothetical protein